MDADKCDGLAIREGNRIGVSLTGDGCIGDVAKMNHVGTRYTRDVRVASAGRNVNDVVSTTLEIDTVVRTVAYVEGARPAGTSQLLVCISTIVESPAPILPPGTAKLRVFSGLMILRALFHE